jgi:hypothetical protein
MGGYAACIGDGKYSILVGKPEDTTQKNLGIDWKVISSGS